MGGEGGEAAGNQRHDMGEGRVLEGGGGWRGVEQGWSILWVGWGFGG